MKTGKRYPTAKDPAKVGSYPARAKAGGGYVWDEVLEYRVWCHPERGAADLADGSDYFRAFATYPKALAFSRRTKGAEAPLALILQRPKRTARTIPDFLSPDAPSNRLAILRGQAT